MAVLWFGQLMSNFETPVPTTLLNFANKKMGGKVEERKKRRKNKKKDIERKRERG